MPCVGGTGSRVLTPAAVAAVVAGQGGPPRGTRAEEWVALARREASNRADCVNPSDHTGLWQIAAIHNASIKPEFGRAQFIEWLKNPYNNWEAARHVYASQGWGAWAASHTPTAADRAAVAKPDQAAATKATGVTPGLDLPNPIEAAGNVIGDTAGAIASVGKGIGQAVGALFAAGAWLSDRGNWARVALVVGGTVITIGAVTIIAKPVAEPVAELGRKAADVAL